MIPVLAAIVLSPLGASLDPEGHTLHVAVYSRNATALQADFFAAAMGSDARMTLPLARGEGDVWRGDVPLAQLDAAGVPPPYFYGYRAFGPNFVRDPSWKPGSLAGFKEDVDGQGNRFNPNKLLLDPYAREISHDPINPHNTGGAVFQSGEGTRQFDSARVAPKGMVIAADPKATGSPPSRHPKDDVIYEVHLRGLTAGDSSLPKELRGTYAGAASRAQYLKSLGINVVEFLPVHESQNQQDSLHPDSVQGDNYWGYATNGFFAPDRRYSSDQSPGGPTAEFQQMVRAFHEAGIKVFLDVVYNHTGEGGAGKPDPSRASLLSFRGLDNQSYYELAADRRLYFVTTGVGNNFNTAAGVCRNLIIDSLLYWKNTMGVDGFRFDLAPVLGNEAQQDGFVWSNTDPKGALRRAVSEVGGPLIAEPWDATGHHNLQGQYPAGWSEWNERFRDTIRQAQNGQGKAVPPFELALRFEGSPDVVDNAGRKPWNAINVLVTHDGFTLADLYRYNQKRNDQPFPFGPSDGGDNDNRSWDQGGDAALQRQAARNGLAALMLSAGVPMITGGDEFLRTQHGNNNAYNVDTAANWIDWSLVESNARFLRFARAIIAFRHAHPALRPAEFFSGKQITWHQLSGVQADTTWMKDARQTFLGWRVDGRGVPGEPATSIFVAWNGGAEEVAMTLPAPAAGHGWRRVSDTAAWMEEQGNFEDPGTVISSSEPYRMHPRSTAIFLEVPASP